MVHGNDERNAATLEVVDRRVAVVETCGVDEDDSPERTLADPIPHEGEAILAGRTEHVDLERFVDRDPPEVHRHRRRVLRPDLGRVVVDRRRGRHPFLGASGSISEIEPTKVVLPTPKPPDTTILADITPR